MEKSASFKNKHYKVYADTEEELNKKAARKIGELIADYYKTYLSREDIIKIEEYKYKHNLFLKSLNQIELEVYNEQQDTMYIHGTTAIEGNTLTLNETYYLLTEGIVPKKSLREINEIQNYKKVRFFVNSYKGKLTIPFIKKLHSFIMNNIDYETAGQFRTKDNIIILGSNISLGLAATIELDLQDLIDSNDLHPFERAILFHYKFEVIHPFTDGNGRTGREILNFMLQKEGYPRFIISKESREMYLKALEHGNKNEIIEMLQIFFELYLESSRVE